MEKETFKNHTEKILKEIEGEGFYTSEPVCLVAAQLLKDYAPNNEFTPYIVAR